MNTNFPNSPAVWPRVIRDVAGDLPGAPAHLVQRLKADMEARAAHGQYKYGTPLRVENDRNAGVDAYRKALDLCAYSRQKYEQTRSGAWAAISTQAVELAASILYQLLLEEDARR